MTKRITKAGVAEDLGVVSEVVGGITSTTHLAYSKVATGMTSIVTSLVGRPIYYQHLLSARNARDALGDDSNGLTVSAAKIALSYVDDYTRIVGAIFAS